MGQSQPFNHKSELVVSYQDRDYPMGGLVIKKGYFVSRNGMRITRSFKTAREIFDLFPTATISDSALEQLLKEQSKQLELFTIQEKRA